MPNDRPPTTAITEYSKTEAALSDLRSRFGSLVLDAKTTAGMKGLVEARGEIRRLRVDLEAKREELKKPVIERGRLIDSEAKRITAELVALEDPIDAQIKAEENRKANEKAAREQAERERIATIQARISEWGAMIPELVGAKVEKIAGAIADFEKVEIDETFAEFRQSAIVAHNRTLAAMRQLHAGAIAQADEQRRVEERARQDAEARERERVEREKAEAAAAERKREIEREQAEARAKIEAEQKAARAEIEREQAEARAKADADRKKREAEEEVHRIEREKIEAERRELERQRQELMDGRALLSTFIDKYGRRKEFATIARAIREFLVATPAPKEKV